MGRREVSTVKLRNVAADCTRDEIIRLCVTFGELRKVELKAPMMGGGAGGAQEAIVTFDEIVDATEAVENLDGAELKGRYIEAGFHRMKEVV